MKAPPTLGPRIPGLLGAYATNAAYTIQPLFWGHILRVWCGIFGVLFAAGCATVPRLEPGLRMSVADLVDRIQCELHESLKAQGSRVEKISGWTVAYALTLTVDEEAGISPDLAWDTAISRGTFTFGIGGGFTATASRQVSLKFTLPVDKLRKYPCDPRLPAPSGIHLDSNLGLTDWLSRVLDAAQGNAFDNFDTFGTLVEFTVEASAKVTPGLELVSFKGPGAASIKRADSHKLNISFDAPPEGKGGVSEASRAKGERSLQRQDFQFLLPRNFRIR